MWPLAFDFSVPDPQWYLRKQHKTHFNSRKNRPGRSIEWFAATKKMREEHLKSLSDPSYKADAAVTENVAALIEQEIRDNRPTSS